MKGCLFEFCIPLIGEKSIQFSNGEDGKRRHKVYSEVLGHTTCCRLIPKFVQVSNCQKIGFQKHT